MRLMSRDNRSARPRFVSHQKNTLTNRQQHGVQGRHHPQVPLQRIARFRQAAAGPPGQGAARGLQEREDGAARERRADDGSRPGPRLGALGRGGKQGEDLPGDGGHIP